MKWLRAYYREQLTSLWEPLELPKGDFDHPIRLSPDWPPHSDLDLAIYEIKRSGGVYKEIRIEQLKKKFGYKVASRALLSLE